MDSPTSPTVKWPTKSHEENSVNILIVGDTRLGDVLIEALYANVDAEARIVETTGRPVLHIGVAKVGTLDETDDVTEVSKKRIDFILLILNPSDSSCLDRAELEYSRIDAMFHARCRVQLCLAKASPGKTCLSAAQLKIFTDRYQNSAVSLVRFDDEAAIKFEASKLFKRLKHIKESMSRGLLL